MASRKPPQNKSETDKGNNGANGKPAHRQDDASSEGVLDELQQQGGRILSLLQTWQQAGTPAERAEAAKSFAELWVLRREFDRQVLFPFLRKHEVPGTAECLVRSDLAALLLVDPSNRFDEHPRSEAKLHVLAGLVRDVLEAVGDAHHGMLARAKEAGAEFADLAPALHDRRMADYWHRDPRIPALYALELSLPKGRRKQKETTAMPMHSNYRERDEQGRFMSDEDRYERRRYRDDDDDDRRMSRGRGQSGWYGDPEGHSRASHRGWEHRDDYRRGRYDDDDDRRYSRSRYDDDDGRGRGHGGWFGDPRGHAEASRRGWDERDERGYGRRYDDDDDRRYSRSRYDDDDRGRRRGGWFGDPEGHSRASRRGWEDR